MSKELAAEAKVKGNKAFQEKDYKTAIEHFTEAIKNDPADHLFYSNRSACYANIKEYQKALEDGEQCVKLNPQWARGYSRKGLALFYLNRIDDAIKTYEEGLKIEPDNEQLKDALNDIKQKTKPSYEGAGGAGGPKSPFGDPKEILNKLQSNPRTREYFKDNDFITKLMSCQSNPMNLLNLMQTDKRFSDVFEVLTGMSMDDLMKKAQMHQGAGEEGHPHSHEGHPHSHEGHSHHDDEAEKMNDEPKVEKEPKKEEKPKSPLSPVQSQAEEEKMKGNEEYKKKEFEKAIEHYKKANELNPKEMIYVLNQASCCFEQGKFNECIEKCDEAIKIGRENQTPFEKIGKAFGRKGNAYMQLKEYQKAVEEYEKSLLKLHDPAIKDAIKNAKKLLDEKIAQDYLDPVKAEEHREKGNVLFREGKFSDSIKEYNEGLKRNPKSSVLYFNRGLALMKVLDYKGSMNDMDSCIALDPKYIKAYIKKAHIFVMQKELHKAISLFEKGLELEPGNAECIEGLQKAKMQVHQSLGEVDEERAKKAMSDPEIQALLMDPSVRQVLKDFQENPTYAQQALNDPVMAKKFERLMASGVLGVKHK